jgi:hypothetical protein
MQNRRSFLSLVICTALVGSGCATRDPVYEGISFQHAPVDISSAWLNSAGDLYVVPEKGVVIDQVVDADGHPLTFRLDGSYLLFPAIEISNSTEIRFLIEKRWRRLQLGGR